MKHFGDPCIHCDTPHDDVAPGPCKGDPKKARILAYCVDRQAWQNPGNNLDTVLCAMSDGSIRTEYPDAAFAYYNPRFKGAQAYPRHEFRQKFRVTYP